MIFSQLAKNDSQYARTRKSELDVAATYSGEMNREGVEHDDKQCGRRGRGRPNRVGKEAILDAAHASLSRNRRTTMQEIAEAAGVGRTTIYRYFPTRRDLEQALSERAQQPAGRRDS